MNLPSVSIKDLLEAGVHLGHKTFRWNPKMKQYIYGEKNSVHIIDLSQTLELLNKALLEIHKIVSNGGRILFVSTKKQASELISSLANETDSFYVNHRWLGGMLTNWNTINNSSHITIMNLPLHHHHHHHYQTELQVQEHPSKVPLVESAFSCPAVICPDFLSTKNYQF